MRSSSNSSARHTANRAGLTVHAEADNGVYPRGIKVTDAQMAAVSKVLKPHSFHGEWNYCVTPDALTYTRMRGRNLEDILGSDGLHGSERVKGTIACQ